MDEKNRKLAVYILSSILIVVLIFSALLSARGFEFGGNKKIEEEALYYINEEILPKENIEGKADIARIDRIIFGDYTHYILAYHENGEIEGRRKEDGSYEFSTNFNN